ncbi:MAG: Energy-coupling factor transporter transmembrane protein EcfT [Methanomassiliicoccales archaeon PtaU1.Bin124]|nr:MAG: Energy-coupling factor transporter transmembrane protein EcfT [Methanomassiliicoccales archaeon PtaU1.Bin124]
MQDEIDRYARSTRLISFDPRVKLAATIVFIVVLAFMREPLAVWISLTFALMMVEISGVPMRHIGHNFLLTFPFILIASLALLLTAGWMSALLMGMRISASILVLLVLVSTTPFFDTLRALRWFRVPPLMCNLMMFTYRFIFVLLDEMGRMRLSRKARGFTGGKSLLDRSAFTTLSNTIGMVFVRANDRANHIYNALLARGYNGEVRSATPLKAKGRDVVFAIAYLISATILVAAQLGVLHWTL